MQMLMIYHIAEQSSWEHASSSGSYRPASLTDAGFIHCSTAEQVIRVANTFYRGRHDLVLLAIDESRVSAEIRYENTEGGSELFPHLYGSLSVTAVTTVYPFTPDDSGLFQQPAPLT
jgi:uncharacterized protein (DUF952 family)